MAAIGVWKILAAVDIDTTIQVEQLPDELTQLGLTVAELAQAARTARAVWY